MFTNSNTSIKKFSHLEKIEIGYRMKLGLGYDEVAEKFGVSRSYAYDLIPYAEKFLQFSNSIDPEARYVALNESLIRKIIVSLILDCGSSEEGVSRFFSEVLDTSVSVSKVSMVLAEAAKKAEEFDKSISLEGIRQGANDEIFQCGIPVLTGIDAETLYIFMMEERPDRKADTWKSAMEEAKSRGLNLDATISDQGTGLIRGIPKAFPEVNIQYDVFHEMMNMGKEIRNLENRAYDRIRKDDAQPTDPPSGFSWFGWRDERRRMRMQTAEYLGHFDEICILYDWMKETMGFTGYSSAESMELAEWIVNSMAETAKKMEDTAILTMAKNLRRKIPFLLNFVKRLQSMMDIAAKEMGVPAEAFRLLYHLDTHAGDARTFNILNRRIDRLLGDRRHEAQSRLDRMIKTVKRASSLVENLNSRIRQFMNKKRKVPKGFFILLKVYFNTKKFRRSEIEERIGKSPLELLTGKRHQSFFEILGL